MRRDEVLTVLRQFKREYAQQYGILEIGVFGSLGRDQAQDDSDVDICIKTRTPDPYALVHIKELIEARVQRPVDIVRVREKMNPYLRKQIDRDAHYV
jgi:uncharacterized protein